MEVDQYPSNRYADYFDFGREAGLEFLSFSFRAAIQRQMAV